MHCGDFSAPWLVSSHAYRMGFHFSVRNTRRNVFMMTQPITDKPILYRRTLGKMRTVSLIDLIYIPNYVEIAKTFVDGRMYGRTNGQSDWLYYDDSKESS